MSKIKSVFDITASFLKYFICIGLCVLIVCFCVVVLVACFVSLLCGAWSCIVSIYVYLVLYAVVIGIRSIILVIRDRQ